MPGERNNIVTDFSSNKATKLLSTKIMVYDYDQVSGDHFQVSFDESYPDFAPGVDLGRDTTTNNLALTNQEPWDLFGVAAAGASTLCSDA